MPKRGHPKGLTIKTTYINPLTVQTTQMERERERECERRSSIGE